MEIVKAVLMLLGGLGTFLVGLKMMGDNLENIAGNKLKNLFNKISNNRFSGVAIGAGVTAIIQSSSATTVMLVGFVNAGAMTLTQAASIIMGANIGTTITAQLVAFQTFPITAFFAFLACIGAFMMMSKKDKYRLVGSIVAGVGVIFIGLYVMSNSMKLVQEYPFVKEMFEKTTNPALLLFMGMLLTAILQSSSATTSLLITLVGASSAAGVHLITLKSAMFVTLGINIGTCITALLASIGTTTNAKRTSIIHLLFNCIGSLLFLIIVLFTPIDKGLEVMFPGVVETQIAMFHTFFNVVTTLLLLPFVKQLTKLSILIVRDKKTKQSAEPSAEETARRLTYIDDRLLGTPSIAMMMARKEILSMFTLSKQNLDLSVGMVTTMDFSDKLLFEQREKRIDYLNGEITKFLIQISSQHISYIDEKELASYYHVLSDVERIGDYAENVVEYSVELMEKNARFSDVAIEHIRQMKAAIDRLYDAVYGSFESKNIGAEENVCNLEETVDDFKMKLEQQHIERLSTGKCPPEAAGVFLSLISNLERVADHMRNVFKSMRSYVKEPLKSKAFVVPEPRAN